MIVEFFPFELHKTVTVRKDLAQWQLLTLLEIFYINLNFFYFSF